MALKKSHMLVYRKLKVIFVLNAMLPFTVYRWREWEKSDTNSGTMTVTKFDTYGQTELAKLHTYNYRLYESKYIILASFTVQTNLRGGSLYPNKGGHEHSCLPSYFCSWIPARSFLTLALTLFTLFASELPGFSPAIRGFSVDPRNCRVFSPSQGFITRSWGRGRKSFFTY